jgi:tetratricopeptide (TPR) repeat protein
MKFISTLILLISSLFGMGQIVSSDDLRKEKQLQEISRRAESTKDLDSALLLYDEGLAIDSSSFSMHQGKVTVYLRRKQLPKAILQTEQLIHFYSEDPMLWMTLGMLYESNGEIASANERYFKSLQCFEKIDTDNNKIELIRKVLCLCLLERQEEANEILDKMKAENPEDIIVEVMGPDLYNFDRAKILKKLTSR